MKLLLDTHIFLWFIMGSDKLGLQPRKLIEENQNCVSIASLWEIAIKTSLNKLKLSKPFNDLFPRQLDINGIELLRISIDHLDTISKLPYHHRDPFDRLLIAQAIVEKMPILSVDARFDEYCVKRLQQE